MSKHTFTRAINHKTVNRAVQADALFKANCKGVATKLNSSGGFNTITIEFNNPLTGSEGQRLSTLVAGLPIDEADLVIDINMEKITKFSEKLIRNYGKKNLKRGYTTTQVRKVVNDLKPISDLLQGKALTTALEDLMAFTATAEITQADIDEFVADITEFLGSL